MNKAFYYIECKTTDTLEFDIFKSLGRIDPDELILAGASPKLLEDVRSKFSERVLIRSEAVGFPVPDGATHIVRQSA